jgi:hypothetical protein
MHIKQPQRNAGLVALGSWLQWNLREALARDDVRRLWKELEQGVLTRAV